MNILLTYSLFMMGLLSYTDWVRLRADKADPVQKKEQCQVQCTSAGGGKMVKGHHTNCRLVCSGSVQNQGDFLEAEQSTGEGIIGLLYHKSSHTKQAIVILETSDLS